MNTVSIYIVLTQTYTLLARTIMIVTKEEYSHASISFNKSCTKMYSFARKYPRNPIIGVFKEESINKDLFQMQKKSRIAIYEIKTTKDKFILIKNKIKEIENNNKGYNVIGLFLASLGIKTNRKKYYCSEFVYKVLSDEKIKILNERNKAVKPRDLITEKCKLIYEGKVSDYVLVTE